jgi:hypothetical protein
LINHNSAQAKGCRRAVAGHIAVCFAGVIFHCCCFLHY